MEPIFQYKMKVRDYELDAQGIVNNANYQHYYEVTRHEFLETNGISFTKLHDQGIDAVVSSVTIKYKKSLVGSDEFYCTLSIEKKGIRYIFNQEIVRISDKAVCSEASIEVVCLVNGQLSYPEALDKMLEKYVS